MKYLIISFILFFMCRAQSESLNINLNINFTSDSAIISADGRKSLQEFTKLRDKFPSSYLVISGHTDSLGSELSNQRISEARARSVMGTLILEGVDPKFMKVKGFGESAPVADNKSLEGRAKNRRVVISIYGLANNELINLQNSISNEKLFKATVTENSILSDYIKSTESQLEKIKIAAKPKSVIKKIPVNNTVINKDEKKYRYQVGLGANFNQLKATDISGAGVSNEAEWLSEINYHAGLAFQLSLGEQFWLGLAGSYQLRKYKSEQEANFSWDETDSNLMNISAILDYEPTKKWGLGFDLDYSEEEFIYITPPRVELIKSSFVGLTARAKYKIYTSKKYASIFNLKLIYPITGSNSLLEPKGKLGYGLSIDNIFKGIFKKHDLNLSVFYDLKSFEHNENEQSDNILGVTISLRNELWF